MFTYSFSTRVLNSILVIIAVSRSVSITRSTIVGDSGLSEHLLIVLPSIPEELGHLLQEHVQVSCYQPQGSEVYRIPYNLYYLKSTLCIVTLLSGQNLVVLGCSTAVDAFVGIPTCADSPRFRRMYTASPPFQKLLRQETSFFFNFLHL